MAEMIRLGAYRTGTDPQVDEAIHFFPLLEEFMSQNKTERTSLPECYVALSEILEQQIELESA